MPGLHEEFRQRCASLGLEAHTQVLETSILTRLQVELAGLELRDGTVDLTKTGGMLTIQHVAMWLQARTGTGAAN